MTKNFKTLITEYKITIPLIQRDYAQGRKEEVDKANNFLEAILRGVKEGLNLDFIYGKIEIDKKNDDKIFIPVDGQQRLTTLLLISWFVSLENEYIQDLEHFSYEVRSSTKDFIKNLISEKSWKKLKKLNVKSSIENANWFFLSWKNDPTVVAILNMLDLIEKTFMDVKIEDLDKITFEFLNLDDFNLTDELYVKMNARGKPLTEFENFKSNFEKYLVFENKKYEQITKAKLDNKWLNMFWKIAKKEQQDNISKAPKLADKMFYNFFYNITFNFYLEQGQAKIDSYQDKKVFLFEKDKLNNIQEYTNIDKFIKDKLYIAKNKKEIYIFKTIDDFIDNVSIFDFYEDVYNIPKNIERLITILDNLTITYDFKNFIFNKKNKKNSKNISYWERARFYTLALGYENNLDELEFQNWKRVTFNLINNQLIQSPENLMNTLKSLNKLSNIYRQEQDKTNKILYYIQNKKDSIDFFHEIQRDEESIKSNLLLKVDEQWKKELIKAEDDWYLNGQIGFLIKYSKVNDSYDLNKFKEYKNKFIALWEFVKDNKKNQIMLYQALLTKGDYLPQINSNYTFCSFDGTSVRIKNNNWRKVFNDSTKTKYFKNLLDDIDKDNLEYSLENIIQNYLENKSYCTLDNIQDKYLFTLISNTENIKYCNNLQLRYYQNGKEVYLLKKNQMNGTHAELYTYNFYKKYFKNNEYHFTNSWDQPCILLNGLEYERYGICIYFDFEIENFKICFEELKGKQIEKKIVIMLELNDFKQEEKYRYCLKTEYSLCEKNKLIYFIQNFTKKLSNDSISS